VIGPGRARRRRILTASFLVLCAGFAFGFAHTKVGDKIEDRVMPTLTGNTAHLLGDARANVIVFFKPGQQHSNVTLQHLAACEKEFTGKSVRWTAVVSDRFSKAESEAPVKEARITMPVVIDVGDALYGSLGVVLTPVIGIADSNHVLAAYLPFAQVNYEETIKANIRYVLGEITAQELKESLDPPRIIQGSDPEIARRRFKLAEKLFQGGSYAKALESARKSVEKDPTAPAAHVLLARILAAQGDYRSALNAYDQALKLDSSNSAALEGKKECEQKMRRKYQFP